MTDPTVSVIIPAYNQAAFLPQAVNSVLAQTFTAWELVIVDDGSTDNTPAIAAAFTDARIRMIRQPNKGLPGARNSGIAASTGPYLAFLDADDYYHPDKLAVQVAYLERNPAVGLCFASRIGIDRASQPFTLQRAEETATLKDLVLGFPFTINDILVRRSVVEAVGGFDESFLLNSEDRDFYLRLALTGCVFGGTRRFLAYRRFHGGRQFANIPAKMDTFFRALDTAFARPDCPAEVLACRAPAVAAQYLPWAYQALVQGDTALGREYLQQAITHQPELLENRGLLLRKDLLASALRDGDDHEAPLRALFAQLPPALNWLAAYADWAVTQGYFLRGVRSLMWGRPTEGEGFLRQAAALRIPFDGEFLPAVADQLLSYELEFGPVAAGEALQNMAAGLARSGAGGQARRLLSDHSINQAFKDYFSGQYRRVPQSVWRAVMSSPRHLTNRGVWAIFVRAVSKIVISGGFQWQEEKRL